MVEDNPADVFLIREMIEASGVKAQVHVAKDGEQATRFFDEADEGVSAPCPALVILDINLPRKRGVEVLEHLRKSPKCHDAAVIVVSTSGAARDLDRMIESGANAYFRKSSEYEEFLKLADLIQKWFPKERMA